MTLSSRGLIALIAVRLYFDFDAEILPLADGGALPGQYACHMVGKLLDLLRTKHAGLRRVEPSDKNGWSHSTKNHRHRQRLGEETCSRNSPVPFADVPAGLGPLIPHLLPKKGKQGGPTCA